jgi:hypothetical protein
MGAQYLATYVWIQQAGRHPTCEKEKKKPSSVRVCLWLSRILYVVGDVHL